MPVYLLNDTLAFPDPNLADDDGLLAVGGDLEIGRLITAYSNGIFPWYNSDEPILWWSPDPRLVIFPHKLKFSKNLLKTISKGNYEIRIDSSFEQVISECSRVARKEQKGTWITSEMIAAYILMHKKGYAHSFEVFRDNKLVGGLYGISLGRMFFGESMFYNYTDASKIAFYYLVQFAIKNNFDLIDAQVYTNHLISMGAEEISRCQYLEILKKSIFIETICGNWEAFS